MASENAIEIIDLNGNVVYNQLSGFLTGYMKHSVRTWIEPDYFLYQKSSLLKSSATLSQFTTFQNALM